MNTYYTAKDIEELAGNGTTQLVLGPGTFLTDFARETAQQLGIVLVRNEDQGIERKPEPQLPKLPKTNSASAKYNKPRGCQSSSNSSLTQIAQPTIPLSQSNSSNGTNNANSVNRLIEMMSKVIKRGS